METVYEARSKMEDTLLGPAGKRLISLFNPVSTHTLLTFCDFSALRILYMCVDLGLMCYSCLSEKTM